MMRIGIDAMGGDYAPEAVVAGAIKALDVISKESRIVLFGDKPQIEAILTREKVALDRMDIVHTTEVIEMGDNPTQAFVKKPDSSIAIGFKQLLEHKIDGFASAGSTGAMMVGCMYTVKQIEGIIRPTISSIIPTLNGGYVLLLDVGLNIDCKPEVLYQYAIIGSIYVQNMTGNKNPRVALLNIGEEPEKGNLQTKSAYELMKGTQDFNFVGNIEGKNIFTGDVADVIVCDGFVGNTVLKMAEGMYSIIKTQHIHDSYFDNFNYEKVGGTPVLGINSNVIIGHGCSSPEAIKNMILQTEQTIRADVANKLREKFS